MTIRRVTFAGTDGPVRFELVYEGFVIGGDSQSGMRGMETLRREGRILDKLEAISVPKVSTRGDATRVTRELKPGTHTLDLEVPEFDLLRQYFERCPWITSAARRVTATYDWLTAAPVVESDAVAEKLPS
jgi:hypothetical protein